MKQYIDKDAFINALMSKAEDIIGFYDKDGLSKEKVLELVEEQPVIEKEEEDV